MSYFPLPLLAAGIAVLVPLVVLGFLRWWTNRERGLLVTVVLITAVLAFLGANFANGLYRSYVTQHTWGFSYFVDIRGNSTKPDAVVVPSVSDERLLAELSLVSGTANWSFVDTPHGRGLYMRFTGEATLSASVTAYPEPSPLPDTGLTMTSTANYPLGAWLYYSGTAGLYLNLAGSGMGMNDYIRPGWNLYTIHGPVVI